MLSLIVTVDNFVIVPSPVLDDSPQGYHLEQRLQLTGKSAADEKAYTIEFRLGDDSQAPAESKLNEWLESAELIQVLCSGLRASPFVQQQGKQYRRQGREVAVGEEKAHLDAMVVFAGLSATPLNQALPLEDAVKQARAAYKRQRRQYQQQRNAERLQQTETQLAERVRQMQERKAAQDAAKAAQAAQTASADAVGANGKGRRA